MEGLDVRDMEDVSLGDCVDVGETDVEGLDVRDMEGVGD